MSELINLVEQIQPKSNQSEHVGEANIKTNINFGALITEGVTLPTVDDPAPAEQPKKKRTYTKRKINTDTGESSSNSNDVPYESKYEENTAMLKTAAMQADLALADLQNDIKQIRSSRTLKKKYDYLAMMQGTVGQFINTKITAVRELNNTITKCNELELRRARDLKMAEQQNQNDDKAIMDMYNAFIHTPVSSGMTLGGVSMQDLTTQNNININTSTGMDDESGFDNYMNTLNPAQKLMMYENDPDVKQVVMYDEGSGSRWFEIMNTRTGEVIQGADKHDMMFMEDTVLDLNNDIAKNLNLGETYPIVRVGNSVVNIY